MLLESSTIWNGHLGNILKAQHRIGLHSENTRPIHSAPYRAELKTREFVATEIDRMLQQKFI